ncbi:MAG: radical SAM protein [Planctomycetota bacterium]
MTSRLAKLKKDWMLRGWTDLPLALVNWTTGEQIELTKKGFYVAEACDGRSDFGSLAFFPDHLAVLDKLIEKGIAEPCDEGDGIDPRQRYRRAENPRLSALQWAITGLCNLNCRHCYMESPSGRYGELPTEDIMRLIEQFEDANVLGVSLTGGEPFLRKDLLTILDTLAQKRIAVSQIFTNGLLVTDEALRSIKGLDLSPDFQVSFDGCGAHDQMRGTKGIEQGVVEAIHRARAAGFQVVVSTCLDKTNRDRMGDTYDVLKGMGIQSWRVSVPQETGNWKGTTTALSLEEEAETYASLARRWLADGRPFRIELGAFFKGNPPDLPLEPEARYAPESYDCGACRQRPYLMPDGTLLPCPGYTDTHLQNQMPNLLKQDLSRAWTESPLRSILNMKKGDLLARNKECAACEWFPNCGMGCRTFALVESGDLMAKDPIACAMWKREHKKRFRELAGLGVPLANRANKSRPRIAQQLRR